MTDAINAHGTQIQIGDGADPEVFTTIADVLDVTGPGLTAETEDVTAHDSGGWREKLALIKDGGQFTFDLNFRPQHSTHSASTGLLQDFNDLTLRNFKVVFTDPAATTWPFAAYVVSAPPSMPVAGPLRASITLEISGAVTLT